MAKQSKKIIRNTILEKLTVSLADYRGILGEKKFDRQIRKTAKRFGEDVIRSLPARDKEVPKK